MRCSANKPDGTRCSLKATAGNWCSRHDPKRAEERRRICSAASKARLEGRLARTRAADTAAAFVLMVRELVRDELRRAFAGDR